MFTSAFKSFSSNIAANYEVSKQPTATVGIWNVFDAKKKGSGLAASIFVLDRKTLDVSAGGFGARASATSVRKAQDEVIERLKKEASSLARLRHPSILQLVEPVEETRSGGLMFATEAVIAPLSDALAQKDRPSSTASRRNGSGVSTADSLEIDELEIQKGLLQVAKGLEFLHGSAKLVHGNLNPDAILINAKSDWKISGLGFAGPPDRAEGHQAIPQISLSEVLYNDARIPPAVQLNLDYTSPDFVLDSNVNFSADMFSLGLILLACYREPHRSPLETHGNQSTYKKIFSSGSTAPSPQNNYLSSKSLPRELQNTLPRILARRPAGRLTAAEFQQSEYFDNILVNTMRFLDGFPAKTPAEKSQFMRGLTRVMPQFPVSVLEKKILAVLLEELKDRELLALILQNVFQIIRTIPSRKDTLATRVLPQLREIFTAQAKSAERDTSKEAGLMVFLENINLMCENSSAQQFKEDALPVIHVAMQSSTHSLVDAGLGTLAVILPVLDFSTVKHDLFPMISAVFAKTSSLGIKVRGLEALGVLCGATTERMQNGVDDFAGTVSVQEQPKNVSSLDKFTMQEKVVPLLKGIKTKEPAVMMAALKVFQQIARAGDIDFLATEVMPILWSFALGPLLDLAQFKAYMDVIRSLSTKIEREQIRKLQELSSVGRSETRAKAASPPGTSYNTGQLNGSTGAEDDFERLVIGSKGGEQKDVFAGALSDGQKLVQNPASYSWTTGSGRTTPAPRVNPMQSSRSITPDVSMSSFPSLQPSSATGTGWAQPSQLQPVPATSRTNSSSWGQQPQSVSSAGTSIWNQPIAPQTSGSSRLQATSYLSSPPSSNASANLQGFPPMLNPPPQSPPPTSHWQQNRIQQPPQSGAFSTLQPGNVQQQQTPQQTQKTGLDKYQSLL